MQLRREVCESEATLETLLGHAVGLAALPFGEYTRRVLAVARRGGLFHRLFLRYRARGGFKRDRKVGKVA
jgi:hypothetical protein